MVAASIERRLANEAATHRLGEDLAAALRPGDVLALQGDLGAGKTTLARALIRSLAGDPELEVPSPTFTLVQTYETRLPVAHFDLYRLGTGEELDELGFDEAIEGGVALVEWPERAGDRLPAHAVTLRLEHAGEGRLATVLGEGPAFDRIARSLLLRDFLATAGWGEAARRPFIGDASARSYEIVALDGHEDRVLMNAPALVLGPPVRDGRAYAEIAHTSRTIAAFVGVAEVLRDAGVTVPDIHAHDLHRGFALLGHLGTDHFLVDGVPVAERYEAAADLLAAMHRRPWPRRLPVAAGIVHDVPPYDREAMLIEVELLVDWYLPYVTGEPADATVRDGFRAAWNAVLDRLEGREETLVLRDVHSPNIVWRPERQGHDRLGMLDFQDALYGPSAYDVASLAFDARVTVPPEIERRTLAAYLRARRGDPAFDETAFVETYAIMAAQRNSKILGIFVRLDRRDGKPAYLAHLPRIRAYLRRALAHPALAGLAAFYAGHGLLHDEAA